MIGSHKRPDHPRDRVIAAYNRVITGHRGLIAGHDRVISGHELSACSNNLKRPIDEIEQDLVKEVKARILDEHFVATVLKEARRRLAGRAKRPQGDSKSATAIREN